MFSNRGCPNETKQPTSPKDSVLNRIDSLVQITNAWLEQIELDCSLKQRYKLYQTENIYSLLQLDTKTGMVEQVQWSLDSENEGSVTINNDDLNYGVGHGSGSFELYPTKNMYQLIHQDYTVMGGEVHINIYDDRVELVSPGAMLDGTQIQDRDIYKVPSMRRNPVIADVFTQLDYMEKRGIGLRKMRELTEKLPNFLQGKEP